MFWRKPGLKFVPRKPGLNFFPGSVFILIIVCGTAFADYSLWYQVYEHS